MTNSAIPPALGRLPSLPRLLIAAVVPVALIGVITIGLIALLCWSAPEAPAGLTMTLVAGGLGLIGILVAWVLVVLVHLVRLARSLAAAVVSAAEAALAMAAGDFTPARLLPATRVREGALLRTAIHQGAQRVEELTTGLEEQVALRTAQLELAKEQAQAARALAEEASKAKSLFLASMGHELRTPLNAIIGYAEMVGDELGGREPGSERDLAQIVTAAHHLLALINDILDYTKSEAGRMQVRREPYDLPAVFSEAVAAVQPLVGQHGNRLEVVLDPRLGAATGDALKLRQVLINLLGNAAKFTEGGHLHLRARMVDDDHFEIEVADDGIGMDARQQSRLFTPFQTSSPQQRHGGSGLGLAICHHYCRLLGGNLSCRSESGVGSTFTVRLPLALGIGDENSSRVRAGLVQVATWSRPAERAPLRL